MMKDLAQSNKPVTRKLHKTRLHSGHWHMPCWSVWPQEIKNAGRHTSYFCLNFSSSWHQGGWFSWHQGGWLWPSSWWKLGGSDICSCTWSVPTTGMCVHQLRRIFRVEGCIPIYIHSLQIVLLSTGILLLVIRVVHHNLNVVDGSFFSESWCRRVRKFVSW